MLTGHMLSGVAQFAKWFTIEVKCPLVHCMYKKSKSIIRQNMNKALKAELTIHVDKGYYNFFPFIKFSLCTLAFSLHLGLERKIATDSEATLGHLQCLPLPPLLES